MEPDIYLFNPTCELAVANGSVNYMAPAHLRRFEDELSILQGILASEKDIVLVSQSPGSQFTDRLTMAGFGIPGYAAREASLADRDFIALAKGSLRPWGWSPAVHKLLAPLKQGCSPEFKNSPVAGWREIHRSLYSRESSLDVLQRIVKQNSSEHWLSMSQLPEICRTHDDIIALQQKWGKVVVKAPWSSSGRGLQILRPAEYNQTNRQIIEGVLIHQQFVIAGPWHEKVLDLSFQFFSCGNGIVEYRGLTSFSTDHAGRYKGTYIQQLPPDLDASLRDFVQQQIPVAEKLLTQVLTDSEYSTQYAGWLGVDALIWRSPEGRLKFQPCLEINCRFTMGAIALCIRKHLSGQSSGEFRIIHGKPGEFSGFCRYHSEKEPVLLENGKIVRGFLPLTPALPHCQSGAFIRIREGSGH